MTTLGTRESRCIAHINDRVQDPITLDCLEFNMGESSVIVQSADGFHELAQALGIKELIKVKGKWQYIMRVSGDSYWTVELSPSEEADFLGKYVGKYTQPAFKASFPNNPKPDT